MLQVMWDLIAGSCTLHWPKLHGPGESGGVYEIGMSSTGSGC